MNGRVINVDVRYRAESSVCPEIISIDYDIQGVLDLMGISSKPLKKVTKVKTEKPHHKKSEYHFKTFQQDSSVYLEVTNAADKKYRSVHLTEDYETGSNNNATEYDC